MQTSKKNESAVALNPKQPEFVLVTDHYSKIVLQETNIAHFYQFKTTVNSMAVIPDACVDILFTKMGNQIETRIAGTRFEKSFAELPLNSDVFGIRFMPGFNPIKKHVSIKEIVNNEMNFDQFILSSDDREALLEKIFYANTLEEHIDIFMHYFSISNPSFLESDPYSLSTVIRNMILEKNGYLKLDEISKATGYTTRYLNKVINTEFGINPKSLIRFIRFQKAVADLIRHRNHVNCTDVAMKVGYYDQSHFISEFKKLAGVTPIQYINHLLINHYDLKLKVL